MTEIPHSEDSLPTPSLDIGGLRGPEDRFHPIKYDLESELTERRPDDELHIFAIKYTDGAERQGDGALFEITPNGATPIMHITKEGYHARRQVVEGSGVLLSILPSGEIHQVDVGANSGEVFNQGQGWVDCWIAGPEGLKIIDSSQPGFQLDFEDPISVDDPSLPPEYWARYHELRD